MTDSSQRLINQALPNTHWRTSNTFSNGQLPDQLRPWLCHQGSLTAALVAISEGTFEVEVLNQSIKKPHWNEQQILNYRSESVATVREVNLKIHGETIIYARSIIPLSLSRRGGEGIASLGNNPLGQLLFKTGVNQIANREFTKIELSEAVTYGRRSPYNYLGERVLVSEFFLPRFDNYL